MTKLWIQTARNAPAEVLLVAYAEVETRAYGHSLTDGCRENDNGGEGLHGGGDESIWDCWRCGVGVNWVECSDDYWTTGNARFIDRWSSGNSLLQSLLGVSTPLSYWLQ